MCVLLRLRSRCHYGINLVISNAGRPRELKTQLWIVASFLYHCFAFLLVSFFVGFLHKVYRPCVALVRYIITGQALSMLHLFSVYRSRTVTRGVNKGAKEDFRAAMERQVGRTEECVESLLRSFFQEERETLLT